MGNFTNSEVGWHLLAIGSGEEHALGPVRSAVGINGLYLYLILGAFFQALDVLRTGGWTNSNPLASSDFVAVDSNCIDEKDVLVGAVVVTEGDFTSLSLVGTQVKCLLLPHVRCATLLSRKILGNCSEVLTVGGNIYAIVLGISAIIGYPELKCAPQFNLWAEDPVVGSDSSIYVALRNQAVVAVLSSKLHTTH